MNKELETNIYAHIRELAMVLNQFVAVSKESDRQNALFYINKQVKEAVLTSMLEMKCELQRTGTKSATVLSQINNYIKGYK